MHLKSSLIKGVDFGGSGITRGRLMYYQKCLLFKFAEIFESQFGHQQ